MTQEHDCKLTEEIIELVDREADLLMRGVKESNLTGLRKRIATLFMQYIKTPTFNPEAANLLKVKALTSLYIMPVAGEVFYSHMLAATKKSINYCYGMFIK